MSRTKKAETSQEPITPKILRALKEHNALVRLQKLTKIVDEIKAQPKLLEMERINIKDLETIVGLCTKLSKWEPKAEETDDLIYYSVIFDIWQRLSILVQKSYTDKKGVPKKEIDYWKRAENVASFGLAKFQENQRLKEEEARLEKENARLEEEKARLEREINDLHSQ